MPRRIVTVLAASAAMTWLAVAQAQPARETPYWASIASGRAMMRTGPGRNYPGIWLYQRRDLPIRVVQTYPNWRKIEDPSGQQGWMLVTLLSDRRTAMVKPGEPRDMRTEPDAGAPVRYRVEAGVVGRIEQCDGQWCRFEVGERAGFIRQDQVWGVLSGERFD